jgi:hypothetical protein
MSKDRLQFKGKVIQGTCECILSNTDFIDGM